MNVTSVARLTSVTPGNKEVSYVFSNAIAGLREGLKNPFLTSLTVPGSTIQLVLFSSFFRLEQVEIPLP
jgi:hypothetical protein